MWYIDAFFQDRCTSQCVLHDNGISMLRHAHCTSDLDHAYGDRKFLFYGFKLSYWVLVSIGMFC